MEHAVTFCNADGQRLVGMWHEPQGATQRDTVVIMLHGWSGYRTGPHQMLTRAARIFAAAGYGVLRFDFAGRGDSEGDAEAATLATMAEDTRAAIAWCRERSGTHCSGAPRNGASRDGSGRLSDNEQASGNEQAAVGWRAASRLVLLGLCSGCEVAFATATEAGVSGLALWSAPVFAAVQSDERVARKRAHHLKQYARKLLRPATYAKLLTGRLDTASIGRAMAGGGGGESKNVEAQSETRSEGRSEAQAEAQVEAKNAAGRLPAGWRAAALKRFEAFRAPLLLVYGTADPTTEEALSWYHAQSRAAPQTSLQTHLVAGANHSYYGLAWEREVVDVTLQWLSRGSAD